MLPNYPKITFLKSTYILFMFLPILLLWMIDRPDTVERFMFTLGKALGVVSLTGLVLQFVMTSRFKNLEKGVGHDRFLRWHQFNAKLITLLVVLHPILVFYAPLYRAGIGVLESFQFFVVGHWLGLIAFLLIFFTVVTTLYGYVIKLDYEVWKWIHRVAYIIVVLGFAHSFSIGTDIWSRGPIFWWWVFLLIVLILTIVYRYPIRWWRLRDGWYEVVNVKQETKDVRTISLKPKTREKLDYAPGQFAFTRFASKDISNEEHHFTISSSPLQEEISFTIKSLGDFTSTLNKLDQGDRVRLEGPYGVFSNQGMTEPFVFIAGGIGITPLMSMIRTTVLSGKQDKTLLLYANRTPDDAVFKEELEKIAQENDWFRVVHIYSDAEVDGAYHGFISEDILKKEISNDELRITNYFLCGPPPMMNVVEKILLSLGAPSFRIYTERFALR